MVQLFFSEVAKGCKDMGIYCWYIPVNNSIYIGSTTTNFYIRQQQHILELRKNKHGNVRLQRIFNKYGEVALNFHILDSVDPREYEYIYDIEQDWLDHFRFNSELNVINIQTVVEGSFTDPLIIEKLSAGNCKRVYDGIISPDGTIYNGIVNLRKFSEEHKLKSSSLYFVVAGKRTSYNGWHLVGNENYRKTPIYSFVSPDGIIVSGITSLKKFCAEYDLQESKMCNVWKGKRNYHKGWTKDHSFEERFRDVRY